MHLKTNAKHHLSGTHRWIAFWGEKQKNKKEMTLGKSWEYYKMSLQNICSDDEPNYISRGMHKDERLRTC